MKRESTRPSPDPIPGNTDHVPKLGKSFWIIFTVVVFTILSVSQSIAQPPVEPKIRTVTNTEVVTKTKTVKQRYLSTDCRYLIKQGKTVGDLGVQISDYADSLSDAFQRARAAVTSGDNETINRIESEVRDLTQRYGEARGNLLIAQESYKLAIKECPEAKP